MLTISTTINSSDTYISMEKLSNVVGEKKAVKYYKYILDTFIKYGIDTKARQCHFLAQVCHETQGLTTFKENTEGFKYELNSDLGNTEVGQGIKYIGRGALMCTGYYNYSKVSEAFGIDLINKPELLEQPRLAFKFAGWLWKKKHLNTLADMNKLDLITKSINGGLNGFSCRQNWFNKFRLN